MNDILLPRSDQTALIQVIVALVVWVTAMWFARSERAVLQLVAGLGLVLLALMAMRTLH